MVQYLKGQGSLEEVHEEWEAVNKKYRYFSPAFLHLSSLSNLDALDLRILDLCIATGTVLSFLSGVSLQSRFDQAYDYLLRHGVDEQQLLGWMVDLSSNAIDRQGQPTPLGQHLLAHIPEQADALLRALENQGNQPYKSRVYPSFIYLLVKAQPPYFDLAWQVAQSQEGAESGRPAYDATLGVCARILLQADLARFTPGRAKSPGQRVPATIPRGPSPFRRSWDTIRRSISISPSRRRVRRSLQDRSILMPLSNVPGSMRP